MGTSKFLSPPSFIIHIRMLRNMLVLWPVISWLNKEMPNRSWGPQSSCRLHCLSYIFACYPRISVVYFVCITSSCLPKSFNLLTDVLSYVHVPTCPSFNLISSLRAFKPLHHISPSLSYLPILHSNITTLIHHTISAHCYPTCPSDIITSIHCTIPAHHYHVPTYLSSNLTPPLLVPSGM